MIEIARFAKQVDGFVEIITLQGFRAFSRESIGFGVAFRLFGMLRLCGLGEANRQGNDQSES